MVLLAMCEFGMTYAAALRAVAEFKHCDPETLHSSICYWILVAGMEVHPARWFAGLVKEVEEGRENDEDGIYAAEGS